MLTYEIHPILCDDIQNGGDTFKGDTFKVEDFTYDEANYFGGDTFKVVTKATKIVMNLYLSSIQKAPFITVIMLTLYTC